MSVDKVKVGERVRATTDWMHVRAGGIYEVVEVCHDGGERYGVYVTGAGLSCEHYLTNEEWEPISSLSPNDTVRLKSGETFTTGSYTAEVDSVTDDKVILKHGSWLPLDAVEKVEHRFKVGDYVRVTDNSTPGGTFKPVKPGTVAKITRSASGGGWMLEGSRIYFYTDDQLEPADPPKFKVGDRVRVVDPRAFRTGTKVGDVGIVTSVDPNWYDDGRAAFWIDLSHSTDGIISQICPASCIELVEPASASAASQPSPREPLVVTMSLDASSFSRDLADQFQRIADSLRAA